MHQISPWYVLGQDEAVYREAIIRGVDLWSRRIRVHGLESDSESANPFRIPFGCTPPKRTDGLHVLLVEDLAGVAKLETVWKHAEARFSNRPFGPRQPGMGVLRVLEQLKDEVRPFVVKTGEDRLVPVGCAVLL